MSEFVHLHVHSEFSLADGLLKIKDLVSHCKALDMSAVALTDINNLFALVKFYQAAKSAGIKPILGSELKVGSDADSNKINSASRVVVLAMNGKGYANLITLVSSGYVDSPQRGVASEAKLFAHEEGLIVLSGGVGGHLWDAAVQEDEETLRACMLRWQAVFGDRYYVEVTRCGRPGEEQANLLLATLASSLGIGVVATNDACFKRPDDYEAHETRVCIHEGRALDDPRRERRHTEQQYLRTGEEMYSLFADAEVALANTNEIAKRCNVEVELGTYYLPDYPVPDTETLDSFLHQVAHEGLSDRLQTIDTAKISEVEYRARLDFELDVINQMGFAGYFLIVMEFIAWAKQESIPVGPGRGSGAGSLVAYSLSITDLDPLAYDLLFERFLNPERVSMPDFDVDFCMEGRDRVIQHVSERYGTDAVSQIITFGTMAAKAVVRDVARVQGKPYGLADKLSKLIPFEVGMTLTRAMDEAPDLAEFVNSNEEVSEIMDMAYQLEGIVRNVGRHAGGVVIAPSSLTDFVPLYTENLGGSLVSQYDKDDVESAGLVKFDFLGLKTLTIIDWTIAAINRDEPGKLEIEDIPLNDPTTFTLLRNANTTAVFQLESRGMKDLIKRLLPDNIDDIIALVALFRPGPLQSGAVDDYINRKHAREPVTFPHPSLEPVLDATYGVVLYQEQVMQIAQELAGFSLGQADLLRRAMGKKKQEEMQRVRTDFLVGTDAREIDHKLSNEIFDLMEKFAGYAFNKSHSATYAVISFQTAWLKTHYPAEFMAANLSAEMQNIDRIVILVDEVRNMEVPLMPPSVNLSEYKFSVQNDTVIYGLGAVRGVGEGPVEAIIDARTTAAFTDLFDFCQKLDSKRVNRRVHEALISAGAMDEFAIAGEGVNDTRARLRAELPSALKTAEQKSRNTEAGMTDMFGEVTSQPHDLSQGPNQARVAYVALNSRERLAGEKDALGIYLTGHPIDEYRSELKQICRRKISDLRAEKKSQWVAGLVVSSRVMKSRRGAPMCFLVLDDRSARLEVALLPECYEKFGSKVAKDELLVFEGQVQTDEFNGGDSLRAEKVLTISEAREKFSDGFVIDFTATDMPADFNSRLKASLTPYRQPEAGCPVMVVYSGPTAQAKISLGRDWRVQPSDDLLHELQHEFGACVALAYASSG
jgi:DNA polymerase-3 subunit alpha